MVGKGKEMVTEAVDNMVLLRTYEIEGAIDNLVSTLNRLKKECEACGYTGITLGWKEDHWGDGHFQFFGSRPETEKDRKTKRDEEECSLQWKRNQLERLKKELGEE